MEKNIKTIIVILTFLFSQGVFSQNAYSTPHHYQNYIQPYDFKLAERVLRTKQNNYENNVYKIYNKTQYISKIIKHIKEKTHNFKYLNSWKKDFLIKYFNTLKMISNWDFSSNENTRNVLMWLEKMEDEFISWL